MNSVQRSQFLQHVVIGQWQLGQILGQNLGLVRILALQIEHDSRQMCHLFRNLGLAKPLFCTCYWQTIDSGTEAHDFRPQHLDFVGHIGLVTFLEQLAHFQVHSDEVIKDLALCRPIGHFGARVLEGGQVLQEAVEEVILVVDDRVRSNFLDDYFMGLIPALGS